MSSLTNDVIDLDSDNEQNNISIQGDDDDIMIINERPAEAPLTNDRQSVTRANHNNRSTRRRQAGSFGDEDEVQIIGARHIPNQERVETSSGLVIFAPNNQYVIQGDPPNEPERRSFSNVANDSSPIRSTQTQRLRAAREERERITRERRESQVRREQAARDRQARRAPRRTSHARYPFGYGLIANIMNPLRIRNQELFDFNDDDYDEDEDPDFFPGMVLSGFSGFEHFRRNPTDYDDRVGQDILNMIEQRESVEFDNKTKKNLDSTKSLQNQISDKAASIHDPFTTKIDTEEEYVCPLCGVTLGQGIPETFKGNILNEPLPKLQELHEVQAPYQACNLITEVDRDLSKRIFIAGCGHTYCGRCVKNITNVKETLQSKKLKMKKTDNLIENPYVYAPSKCVAPDCEHSLRIGKRRFNEVFL
ncbi:hypothetical protein WICMUC_001595 [Wickerhamomyces mucosus]|uniref:Uncharacterized protein n=1 Tax=Wickerhamomyces mucosus TaxID=1378264 RepID=A0A9P8PW18_9ASCO|nr:hypothetical protein WICMUC_001595 [Wickerhamomyces mucosus]